MVRFVQFCSLLLCGWLSRCLVHPCHINNPHVWQVFDVTIAIHNACSKQQFHKHITPRNTDLIMIFNNQACITFETRILRWEMPLICNLTNWDEPDICIWQQQWTKIGYFWEHVLWMTINAVQNSRTDRHDVFEYRCCFRDNHSSHLLFIPNQLC